MPEISLFAYHSLPPYHKRERLQWCIQHEHWTQLQWASAFMGETAFSLQPDSRRLLIWREPTDRYHPSNIMERDQYVGGGLTVYAGIIPHTAPCV
ncbi:hypothetical protein X975_25619, partial [Stegodyphus mimosarum]